VSQAGCRKNRSCTEQVLAPTLALVYNANLKQTPYRDMA
jgi:hypothetical protein